MASRPHACRLRASTRRPEKRFEFVTNPEQPLLPPQRPQPPSQPEQQAQPAEQSQRAQPAEQDPRPPQAPRQAQVPQQAQAPQQAQGQQLPPARPIYPAQRPYPAPLFPAPPYPAAPYPAAPPPAAPYTARQYPAQPYPAAPYPAQPYPAAPYPAAPYPAPPSPNSHRYPPAPAPAPAPAGYPVAPQLPLPLAQPFGQPTAFPPSPGVPYFPPQAQAPAAWPVTPPQKKGRSWLWWTLGGGTVAIVLIVALVVSLSNVMRSISGLTDTFSRPGASGSVPGTPFGDRKTGADMPSYAAAEALITATHEKYSTMSEEEFIPLFPNGAAGYDGYYVRAFVRLLDVEKGKLDLYAASADFAGDLDAKIQAASDATKEAERKFLAQEPFGEYITLEDGNGGEQFYNGSYFARGTAAHNAQLEVFARGFAPYSDGNGSYLAAANELAVGIDMELKVSVAAALEDCNTTRGVADLRKTTAMYCRQTPGVIYINEQRSNYDISVAEPFLVDAVKHEFAHARIHRICDATSPAGVPEGVSNEAVTNSYAVLFLGADRGRMSEAADGLSHTDYVMSDASDAAAKLIHEGRCL